MFAQYSNVSKVNLGQVLRTVVPLGIRDFIRRAKAPDDILSDHDFMALYKICAPYTMTSIERMYMLYKTVEYIAKRNISGDFVECGVWRGGSVMLAAMAFEHFNDHDRRFYLFDTFEGMTTPTTKDISYDGKAASDILSDVKCEASLENVKANIAQTDIAADRFIFVKGPVEDTIPHTSLGEISILRLDTDWYNSTKHELSHLYPLLVKNGVLIIDDYGHWQGARTAVDEYFSGDAYALLSRIDYTGRLIVKQDLVGRNSHASRI